MSGQDPAKRAAARAVLDSFVKDGMTIGLGSGSTAEIFVRLLGERIQSGSLHKVSGIASSSRTKNVADNNHVSLRDVKTFSSGFDLMIDGADEIDDFFRAVKGGGGCLFREKALAHMAKQLVLIVDESKCVETLGAFPLAVEVVSFSYEAVEIRIQKLLQSLDYDKIELKWRMGQDGKPFETDNGNFVLDCALQSITDAQALARGLKQITGVVEHGLFLDEADAVIIGKPDGSTETRTRTSA